MAGLDSIDHVILLMLENRSFDHLLGYLYPRSDTFDGLDGSQSNLDPAGTPVSVYPITPDKQNAYYYPLANPAEGFTATNYQLFSSAAAPADGHAANDGFVSSFATELAHPAHPNDPKLVGAEPSSIMGMYSPETLPVLSGLAKGFAVCDRWFASVPTQTFPNRAFAVAGTSLGYTDNSARSTPAFDTDSVFGRLGDEGQTWTIYGYSRRPLTANDFPDTYQPGPGGTVKSGFQKFQSDAASGQLATFSYIEPEWAISQPHAPPATTTSRSRTTNIRSRIWPWAKSSSTTSTRRCVATRPSGRRACSSSPTTSTAGPTTTYRPKPAPPLPTTTRGPELFDFTRFGVRVPAVIVSPMIPAGTVFRAPTGSPPYDHTSIIATLRARFSFDPLGNRDAVAPHLGPILTLAEPRGDDPLKGVTVPTAADPILQPGSAPIGAAPSSFLEAKAIAAAELPVPSAPIENPEQTVAGLSTAAEQDEFIQHRLQQWETAGKPLKP